MFRLPSALTPPFGQNCGLCQKMPDKQGIAYRTGFSLLLVIIRSEWITSQTFIKLEMFVSQPGTPLPPQNHASQVPEQCSQTVVPWLKSDKPVHLNITSYISKEIGLLTLSFLRRDCFLKQMNLSQSNIRAKR